MSIFHTVNLDIRVTDPQALYVQALAKCIEDGMTKREAHEIVGTKRNPNVKDCLQWLIDPGVSPDGTKIDSSYVT